MQAQISVGKPPAQFISLLVETLLDYGRLNDGQHALASVLEVAKTYVGQDKKVYCEALIQELNENENLFFLKGQEQKSIIKNKTYKTIIYAISIAILAFLIIYWSEVVRFSQILLQSKKETLTRLETENILQGNRGNIERCISNLQKEYFYIDFLFNYGEGGINIDIFPPTDSQGFFHPSLKAKEVERNSIDYYFNRKDKLSVIFPEVNKCIVETIKDKFKDFTLAKSEPFAHRYITDIGASSGEM